jgi:hypothetical protein
VILSYPRDFTPAVGYEYDEVSEFDKKCGTFNTTDYQLPNAQCPDKFVCDVVGGSAGLGDFAERDWIVHPSDDSSPSECRQHGKGTFEDWTFL